MNRSTFATWAAIVVWCSCCQGQTTIASSSARECEISRDYSSTTNEQAWRSNIDKVRSLVWSAGGRERARPDWGSTGASGAARGWNVL